MEFFTRLNKSIKSLWSTRAQDNSWFQSAILTQNSQWELPDLLTAHELTIDYFHIFSDNTEWPFVRIFPDAWRQFKNWIQLNFKYTIHCFNNSSAILLENEYILTAHPVAFIFFKSCFFTYKDWPISTIVYITFNMVEARVLFR